jgi:hypothetical protein
MTSSSDLSLIKSSPKIELFRCCALKGGRDVAYRPSAWDLGGGTADLDLPPGARGGREETLRLRVDGPGRGPGGRDVGWTFSIGGGVMAR